MACPKLWIVHWHALGAEPAGSMSFTQRARARGLKMIRRAAGFHCWVEVQ